jgi:hypothetical protein
VPAALGINTTKKVVGAIFLVVVCIFAITQGYFFFKISEGNHIAEEACKKISIGANKEDVVVISNETTANIIGSGSRIKVGSFSCGCSITFENEIVVQVGQVVCQS